MLQDNEDKEENERKQNIKGIFSLAAPIMIENALHMLLGTMDMYFAGRLEDRAIAGIGVTNLVMNLFISFFTAVNVGATAVTARHYGGKDFGSVNRSIVHSLVMGAAAGIASGGICAAFSGLILHASGAEEAVIEYARPYYLAVAVPCVVLSLQLVLSSCLRAVKDTRTPMYVTGISNVFNILLDLLFIRAGWGILGLGLATTLSRCVSVCVLFLRLRVHDRNIKLSVCKPEKETFASILRIGIPAGMEKLIMRVGQLIYGSMILSMGTTAYIAHNITGNIESYSYIPATGIGLAVCTLVGVALGENDVAKARETASAAYRGSLGLMVLFGAVFFIFAPGLASLFTETAEIRSLVAASLRVIALFQPFVFLVQIMTNALQGAGDTRFPMYATLIGIWGIRMGVGYLLASRFHLGLVGVWYAYGFDVTVRGMLLWGRFRKGKWKKARL